MPRAGRRVDGVPVHGFGRQRGVRRYAAPQRHRRLGHALFLQALPQQAVLQVILVAVVVDHGVKVHDAVTVHE